MAIRPPKILPIEVTDREVAETWDLDDGSSDPFLGQPYRWEVTCAVLAQPHSYHLSTVPYFYNGMDVELGDWIATSAGGAAVKIISISVQTATELVCVVEDVDRFNTFLDPQGAGIGIGQTGTGFLFELGDDGLPLLAPVKPGVLPFEFQVDLLTRFRYRNLYQNNYRVEQNDHGFTRGNLIYLDSMGNYSAAKADVAPTARIIGMVQDAHHFPTDPTKDWFSYQPIGRVIRNITPALPGSPGSIIYLSDSVASQYSTTQGTLAKPVFIQLETNTSAVMLERGFEGAVGESANVYMVSDLDEMMALTDVNEGSQVYVRDAGQQEWAIFLRTDDASSGYRMLINQDASDTDAETFATNVTVGSDPIIFIARVSPGSRVLLVTVRVTEAFDDLAATLSVGDADNAQRLLPEDQVDLGEIEVYQVNPPYQYPDEPDVETEINVYFNGGTSSAGSAVVVISYT